MKTKRIIKTTIIVLLLIATFITVFATNYYKELNEWNNGKCECDGTYTFTHEDKTYYYYVCDNCKNVKRFMNFVTIE